MPALSFDAFPAAESPIHFEGDEWASARIASSWDYLASEFSGQWGFNFALRDRRPGSVEVRLQTASGDQLRLQTYSHKVIDALLAGESDVLLSWLRRQGVPKELLEFEVYGGGLKEVQLAVDSFWGNQTDYEAVLQAGEKPRRGPPGFEREIDGVRRVMSNREAMARFWSQSQWAQDQIAQEKGIGEVKKLAARLQEPVRVGGPRSGVKVRVPEGGRVTAVRRGKSSVQVVRTSAGRFGSAFSSEDRARVVAEAASTGNLSATARKYGIPRTTLSTWRKEQG